MTCTNHMLNGFKFLSAYPADIVSSVWILRNILLTVIGTNDLTLITVVVFVVAYILNFKICRWPCVTG